MSIFSTRKIVNILLTELHHPFHFVCYHSNNNDDDALKFIISAKTSGDILKRVDIKQSSFLFIPYIKEKHIIELINNINKVRYDEEQSLSLIRISLHMVSKPSKELVLLLLKKFPKYETYILSLLSTKLIKKYKDVPEIEAIIKGIVK